MPGTSDNAPAKHVILLIENDENDVFLVRRALGKLNWNGDLRVVGSVSEARAFLENSFPFKDRGYYRRPCLILSDYRLNSHTSLEFITWIHEQPDFKDIATVMLTGADSHIPPEHLARMSVTGFIVKNPNVVKLGEVLKEYLPQEPGPLKSEMVRSGANGRD